MTPAARVSYSEFVNDVERFLGRVQLGESIVVEGDAVEIVVKPSKPRRSGKAVSDADVQAFRATAGAMRDLIDADDLKRRIREGRSSGRPPVRL